ncbi:MAG: prepilin peptidase [Lachnospiraceae bacterium]|nr:prepilin peptidase [Lachnospiraceae bacterium]
MLNNLLFSLFLLICAITDLIRGRIYLGVIICFGLLGILSFFLFPSFSLPEALGGAALGVLLLALSHFSGGKIGSGDAFMLMVSGFYLGIFENLRFLMLGMLLAAALSILLLILKRVRRNTALPFAPFLMLSFAILKLFPM